MDSDLQGEVIGLAVKIVDYRAVPFRNDERSKVCRSRIEMAKFGKVPLLDLIYPMNSIK
jgi:hypothetical protein